MTTSVSGIEKDCPTSVSFSILCTQVVQHDGSVRGELPDFAQDKDQLVELYQAMHLNRIFDERAVALQRTGRLGTFASSLGQEAVSVGVANAMAKEDVFLPSFREQGGQLLRGVSARELLMYWGGDERGSHYEHCVDDFPVCIPVGSQFPHAVGVAMAFKIKNEQRVAVVVGGDGSTSKGDFYEAINIAGALMAPVVFIIDNNQWAISTRRQHQSAARTLAQKAIAAGIPGQQVDGNDVVAVSSVTQAAINRARDGQGPSLIEAISYRLSDHTTADDAHRYRRDEEVTDKWHLDPIARIRTLLANTQGWTTALEKRLVTECTALVDNAVEDYLQQSPAPATDMFDYLYAVLPIAMRAQRQQVAIEPKAD